MDSAQPIFDAAFWSVCGGIVLLLILSAFFSGSETALTAASRGKLKTRAERGEKGAERALAVTEDSEQPGQHPCRVAGNRAVHPCSGRKRGRARDAGHDLPGPDLR